MRISSSQSRSTFGQDDGAEPAIDSSAGTRFDDMFRGVREVLIVGMTSSGGSASYVFPLIIVVAIVMAGFWLWALVDVLSWPAATWDVAGLSKARWVMRVLLLGVLGSVLYLRSARGRLRAAYSTVRTAGRR